MKDMLERINNSAIKFLTPQPIESTYKTIIKEAVSLVGAKYGSIYLKDENGFERVYNSISYTSSRYASKLSNVATTFEDRRTSVIPIEKNKKASLFHIKKGFKSTVFIPLSYQKKAIGVITLNSVNSISLSEKESDLLDLYGAMASLAIKKAKLYSDLKEAIQTRDLFISMAAHELRTPLTTVYGYMQLIQKQSKKTKSLEPEWIDTMIFHTKRLYRLVDDLLEVNKIKTGEFEYHWRICRISEIIKSSIGGVKIIYPNRIVRYSENKKLGEDEIIGDSDKLVLVVSNLLENALKFSPADTPVTLEVESKSQFVKIKIRDKGKGIKKSEIIHVLNGLYKSKDNYKEGMGIGLFLAHRIIINHRGTITLVSKRTHGTEVVITLPKFRK